MWVLLQMVTTNKQPKKNASVPARVCIILMAGQKRDERRRRKKNEIKIDSNINIYPL